MEERCQNCGKFEAEHFKDRFGLTYCSQNVNDSRVWIAPTL